MARLDGKISAAGETKLDLSELVAALGPHGDRSVEEWRSAIACYLSASEGWREASHMLGGAFASDEPKTELSGEKQP